MIVVDTNVISYLLIRGERSEAMDRLYRREPHWVAPSLWADEFINVVCTYERAGLLRPEETYPLVEEATQVMAGGSYEVPPQRILEVARRTGCSGYDSQYIALAEDLGVPLYTCDGGILDRCGDLAVLPQ